MIYFALYDIHNTLTQLIYVSVINKMSSLRIFLELVRYKFQK